MNEFIQKYRNFKIYDENARVYPLHISRALNQDQDLAVKDEQIVS
jgi:hypothetical protein